MTMVAEAHEPAQALRIQLETIPNLEKLRCRIESFMGAQNKKVSPYFIKKQWQERR